MMRVSCFLFALALILVTPSSSTAADPKPLDADEILSLMERVADWQLAHPSSHPTTDWTQGAGAAGFMALTRISSDPKYDQAMQRLGATNHWKLGRRMYHADDHVIGQTYCELYFVHRNPAMIASLRGQFDRILAEPRHFETLDFTQRRIGDVWSWCDALFMGPPTWIRLWKATDDPRYLEFAVTNWWRTSDYLYDAEEHLYFRDSTYFNRREANGRKIFWSRGNGWVMGGLVRMLQYLPADHPSRPRFVRQFRDMADALLQCQQPDGLWRASLLDPDSYPLKETSGSGFHTYALAWGVNEGLLDRARFEPAIRAAWAALTGCVESDGKLTHVQPIGADPKAFDSEATEVYGVGAFLLAGSEMHRLARNELRVPNIIGHHMVLQHGRKIPLWGRAAPGQRVSVSFAGQTQTTEADQTGAWKVTLKALKPSRLPSTLIIRAERDLIFTNILVGEVWFCSGQSNMEKPLGEQRGQRPTFNYEQELAAGNLPSIRLFKTGRTLAASPAADVKGSWGECSSNRLAETRFSAAAYFFGRELHRELNMPIGLIEASWGGTRSEPWTPLEVFADFPELASATNRVAGTNKVTQAHTAALFNGMVAPIIPFGIRGVIWYQGESNFAEDANPGIYTRKMEALIAGWRRAWDLGPFPFYYVQIAPLPYSENRNWKVKSPDELPVFWEAQTRALSIRNTGMIVTTDLVDDIRDIHPRNKLDVGKRLARVALAKTYGRDIEYSGPVFRRMKRRDGQAVLTFDHARGLKTRDGAEPTWFEIAGSDGRFLPAKATIRGEQVIVSNPGVPHPGAVRFAWHETAQPNLCNADGLPAVPFRTPSPRR